MPSDTAPPISVDLTTADSVPWAELFAHMTAYGDDPQAEVVAMSLSNRMTHRVRGAHYWALFGGNRGWVAALYGEASPNGLLVPLTETEPDYAALAERLSRVDEIKQHCEFTTLTGDRVVWDAEAQECVFSPPHPVLGDTVPDDWSLIPL